MAQARWDCPLITKYLRCPERPHSRKKETIIGFLVIEHDVCLLRTKEGCTEILNVASNLLCSPTIINSCPSAKQRKEKKKEKSLALYPSPHSN